MSKYSNLTEENQYHYWQDAPKSYCSCNAGCDNPRHSLYSRRLWGIKKSKQICLAMQDKPHVYIGNIKPLGLYSGPQLQQLASEFLHNLRKKKRNKAKINIFSIFELSPNNKKPHWHYAAWSTDPIPKDEIKDAFPVASTIYHEIPNDLWAASKYMAKAKKDAFIYLLKKVREGSPDLTFSTRNFFKQIQKS